MPKRVVRLSLNQVAASLLRRIFGDAFADEMITAHDIADPAERTFPAVRRHANRTEPSLYTHVGGDSDHAVKP